MSPGAAAIVTSAADIGRRQPPFDRIGQAPVHRSGSRQHAQEFHPCHEAEEEQQLAFERVRVAAHRASDEKPRRGGRRRRKRREATARADAPLSVRPARRNPVRARRSVMRDRSSGDPPLPSNVAQDIVAGPGPPGRESGDERPSFCNSIALSRDNVAPLSVEDVHVCRLSPSHCGLRRPCGALAAPAVAQQPGGQQGDEEETPTPAPLTVGSMAIASDAALTVEAMAVDVAVDRVTYAYKFKTRGRRS